MCWFWAVSLHNMHAHACQEQTRGVTDHPCCLDVWSTFVCLYCTPENGVTVLWCEMMYMSALRSNMDAEGPSPPAEGCGNRETVFESTEYIFWGLPFFGGIPTQNTEFRIQAFDRKKTNKEDLWIFRIFRTVFVLVNTCLFLQRVSKCLINVCTGFVPKVLYV